MSLKKRSIAFIGAGHITEIIVSNLTKADSIVPRRLIASDPVQERLEKLQSKYGISIAEDNLEAINTADFVFINVRPNIVEEAIKEFRKRSASSDVITGNNIRIASELKSRYRYRQLTRLLSSSGLSFPNLQA